MTPLLAQRPRSDRAFERMYRRHVGDVYRYALAVMRNPADAEDVTQTTFLNAYRSFVEKGNRPEKPQNWLIAIAHNVCRQRFRQSARRPSEVSFEDDIADSIVDDETPSGEDIRRALSHLAFNQRAALVMRELEGRSYAEIAEILDLSTSAVETLIFRARRALREQLEGSLTCGAAELAISRQLDGRLTRPDKGQLRAHLRECADCASFARRQRAQRSALKSLGLIPVPSSLLSLFGGGGGAVGTGLAIKAAAAVTAGIAIGGAGYEGVRHSPWLDKQPVDASSSAPEQGPPAPRAAAAVAASPDDARAMKPGQTKAHDAAAKTPPGQIKKADGATGKRTHKLHPSGKGHQKTRYAGDAGVAARHVKVRHSPTRVRPAPPLQSHRKVQRNSVSRLPGPFDTKPPAGKKSK
jgi:RNA polymerase sigma factor (sigma-70 family)